MRIVFVIKLLLLLAVSAVSLLADTAPPFFALPVPAKAKVETCSGYTELYSPGHMRIGVNLNILEVAVQSAFMEAMKYWALTLDMEYSKDESLDTCVIELMYVPASTDELTAKQMEYVLAYTHGPSQPTFDGVIYWNNKFRNDDGSPTSRQELVSVFIHELGHVFGLLHTQDRRSVMYIDAGISGKLLTVDDLFTLSEYHELKRAMRQYRENEGSGK